MWTTGVVEDVKESKDSHVRTVHIRLVNGSLYARPITKVMPLEFQSL